MLTTVGSKRRVKIGDITPINIQPWDSGCFIGCLGPLAIASNRATLGLMN